MTNLPRLLVDSLLAQHVHLSVGIIHNRVMSDGGAHHVDTQQVFLDSEFG